MRNVSRIFCASLCICATLSGTPIRESSEAEKGMRTKVKSQFRNAAKSVEGWCSDEKGSAMIDLVLATKPSTCVEIGVFGGSSILPTALALKTNGMGVVYAIDPWDNSECVKGQDAPNSEWWGNVDLGRIFNSFKSMLATNQLQKHVVTLRTTAENAAEKIEDIDILHIDGNHSEDAVMTDVKLYFPKVKRGGYIWCDDFKWAIDGKRSTLKAYEILLQRCDLVLSVDDGSCILLQKR
jgi:cephalosporin hydroxylase